MRRNEVHDGATGRFVPGGPRVVRACTRCGDTYERTWAARPTRFCSKACQLEYQMGRRARTCDGCGVGYVARRAIGVATHYCSRACFDANRVRPAAQTVDCANCGTTHQRQRSWVRSRLMFCGVGCQREYLRDERHPNYRPGPFDQKRSFPWRKLAASIRIRDNQTCRLCGVVWVTGQRAFPVDHIVPRRSFETRVEADDPENLATLCAACHASKTFGAERRWLKGDALDLVRYQRQVRETA